MLPVNPDATWSMPQLLEAFETLTQTSPLSDVLAIEQKKSLIIKLALEKLQRALSYRPVLAREANNQTVDTSRAKKSLYYFLLGFGLFDNTASSYFFGSSLFELIPGISTQTLMAAALVYTLLEGVLFYVFDVYLLNEALGVPYTKTQALHLIDIYTEQLDMIRELNQQVSSMAMLTLDETSYTHYVALMRALNQDLQQKDTALGHAHESWFQYGMKLGILSFGSISSIAGSYFMATALMGMFASSLVGTPVGLFLIALTVVTGLSFHYTMGMTGIGRVVNPHHHECQDLKKAWGSFLDKHGNDSHHLPGIKHRFFEKKSSQDASTQTLDEAMMLSY